MIAEVLKDEYWSLEEMAKIIKIKSTTLKRRVSSGTNHPPVTIIAGEYLFPKDLFPQWARNHPILWEVRSVG